MRIGTKSLLFGAHQFVLHPLFLARAWWILYGFPWDPRLWVAFVVHDWGYWGTPDMDGIEGARHPEFGAWIMGKLFGPLWHDFTLYHSRRYARGNGKPITRLCVADKLVPIITPPWLYVPMVRATGELAEYMKPDAALESEQYMALIEGITDPYEWFASLKSYMMPVVSRIKETALSINDLRWQRRIDRYIAIYGEDCRDNIIDALLDFDRHMSCKAEWLQDDFIEKCCT